MRDSRIVCWMSPQSTGSLLQETKCYTDLVSSAPFSIGVVLPMRWPRITVDFESGGGYRDIRLQRLRGNGPNVVMEIKRVTGEPSAERMEAVAREALAQIRKMNYIHGLEGRTVLYGIAFSGKTPTTVSETIGS